MAGGFISWIGVTGYSAAALAFAALALRLGLGWRGRLQGGLLLAACLLTALWAGDVVLALLGRRVPLLDPALLELLQSMVWVAFLWQLAIAGREGSSRQLLSLLVLGALAAGGVSLLLEAFHGIAAAVGLAIRLVLVVTGLVLLENILRNSTEDDRWKTKFLIVGLGGAFVFDLFFYANSMLFLTFDTAQFEARGLVYALITPLIALAAYRNDFWRSDIVVSRTLALYSTTILISGLYVIAMAAAAYAVERLGGSWGATIQILFLFVAIVFLSILLLSGTYRAYLKVLVSKHFFRYRYDYRKEWLQFTRVLTDSGSHLPMADRALRGIADLLDSPAGALWLRDEGSFAVSATWNMAVPSLGEHEAAAMVELMSAREWIVILDESEEMTDRQGRPVIPEALRQIDQGWIVVPLLHAEGLVGFVLLARPRVQRRLDWEDFDLLRAVGHHASSYLVEQRTAMALAEGREFEKFNRRAAFVLHDLKNVMSQLSLFSKNVKRHGENPEFRGEMVSTLEGIVTKMDRLIERMSTEDAKSGAAASQGTALVSILRKLAETAEPVAIEMRADPRFSGLEVKGDADRLQSLFAHLVDNAVEAAGEGGWVRLSLFDASDKVVVEVSDSGPGMTQEFIQNQLFRPFHSTKSRGMGIGVYQCRDYARQLGGDLKVISSPGSGTTMRVSLPLLGHGQPERMIPAAKAKA